MEGMIEDATATSSPSSSDRQASSTSMVSQSHTIAHTDGESDSLILPTTKKICQECSEKEALYVCPRCSFRSCSLACCVAHKKRLQCNGKRVIATDNNAFIPLSRMTDVTMQEDYHFLEHVLQTVESNQRKRPPTLMVNKHHNKNNKRNNHGNHKRPRQNPPTEHMDESNLKTDESTSKEPCHPLLQQQKIHPSDSSAASSSFVVSPSNNHNNNTHTLSNGGRHSKFKNLQRLAAFPQRRVNLVLMSPGMQRTLQNKSFVKKQVIHWTVECVVHAIMPHNNNNKKNNNSHNDSQDFRFLTILSEEADLHTELYQLVEKRQRELRKLNARDQTVEALLARVNLQEHSKKEFRSASGQGEDPSFPLLLHQPTSKTYRSVAQGTSLREALWDAKLLEFPTFHWVAQQDCTPDKFPQPFGMDIVASSTATTAASATNGEGSPPAES